jgi:hypothetical protein
MLTLPSVTLCCIYDRAHELHALAVDECLRRAEFGDVKTGAPVGDYARFVHYEMPKQLKTSHVLLIQWDSWIVNPDAWRPEFLDFDYVGAPWWYKDGYNVGNSGFCLLSKRLMEFLAEHENEFPVGQPYDHVLCREHQKRLPQFKWAPDKLAWHFAIERTAAYPMNEVFGFHGLFNFPFVLGPEALRDRLELAGEELHITSKPEWREVRALEAAVQARISAAHRYHGEFRRHA